MSQNRGLRRLDRKEKYNISTTEGELVNELKVIKSASKILNLDVATLCFLKSILIIPLEVFLSSDECSLIVNIWAGA